MPKRMSELGRAERELEEALGTTSRAPAVEELARSQRLLAEALNKSGRLRRSEDEDGEEPEEEDEVDEQQEDDEDEDEDDEEEDEDQDPDDPDEGTGRDDLRGTVGRRPRANKSRRRAEKSRRRRKDDLRQSRRGRPKWAGDEDDEDDDEREDDFEDVEAAGNGAYAGRGRKGYYRNEDANHEEDEVVPPDGPDVADGDDEDVFTIGSHKVHSERAMRRSGRRGREEVYRSFARVPGAADAIEAEPYLAALVDSVGGLAERLEKSARVTAADRQLLRALASGVSTLSKAMAQLTADVQLIKSQPQTGIPWGTLPPRTTGSAMGGKKGSVLAKSRSDVIANAEGLMRSGRMDSRTFQAIGSATTVEDMAALLTPEQCEALGIKGVA